MQHIPRPTPPDAFIERLIDSGAFPLRAAGIDILQMNITRRCNLACKHCHVQAGPQRTETMSRKTMIQCIEAAGGEAISTVDITGGNLVILLEPIYRRYMDTFAAHNVELVGSLPDYHADRSDRQRGDGAFEKAIQAIRELNRRSYGMPDSGLLLHLAHNPVGAYLPGSQTALEAEYRRVLSDSHGLKFNTLFCLVNNPIGRYADYLKRSGNWSNYMRALQCAFNIRTVSSVMCRTTLSVGWDGRLYDCDFNQMLDMTVNSGAPKHIRDFDYARLAQREIVVRSHCFACTAGAGSSCQGSLE
jgi:radical SAM/Cys-rich protein